MKLTSLVLLFVVYQAWTALPSSAQTTLPLSGVLVERQLWGQACAGYSFCYDDEKTRVISYGLGAFEPAPMEDYALSAGNDVYGAPYHSEASAHCELSSHAGLEDALDQGEMCTDRRATSRACLAGRSLLVTASGRCEGSALSWAVNQYLPDGNSHGASSLKTSNVWLRFRLWQPAVLEYELTGVHQTNQKRRYAGVAGGIELRLDVWDGYSDYLVLSRQIGEGDAQIFRARLELMPSLYFLRFGISESSGARLGLPNDPSQIETEMDFSAAITVPEPASGLARSIALLSSVAAAFGRRTTK